MARDDEEKETKTTNKQCGEMETEKSRCFSTSRLFWVIVSYLSKKQLFDFDARQAKHTQHNETKDLKKNVFNIRVLEELTWIYFNSLSISFCFWLWKINTSEEKLKEIHQKIFE